jgi:hypothetical protein
MAVQLDHLTRIVNVQWGSGYYVIIAATNNDFATSNGGNVKVLETRSVFIGGGEGVEPVSGTLIESPGNAGDRFVTLNPTSSNILGLEQIFVFVCPKTSQVKNAWFDYVLSPYDGTILDRPFLWIAFTMSGSPNVMDFKIRVTGGGENEASIVQAYPTSGNNTWPFGNDNSSYVITGWIAGPYRLDKNGTGTIYPADDAWFPDNVVEFVPPAPEFNLKGLKFGKDPAAILKPGALRTRDLPMAQFNAPAFSNAVLTGGGVPPESRP